MRPAPRNPTLVVMRGTVAWPAMPVTIRAERPEDFDAISRVVAAAFNSQIEADLVLAIRASEHYVGEWALVAELDEVIVGHVMLSYSALHLDDGSTRPVLQ